MLIPAQIISGIVWAGYDVTIFNMFLDVTSPDKRAVQTATYSIITSVPLAIAPVLGGFIADNVVIGLAGIPLVFAISMVMRFFAPMLLLKIPERRVKHEYPLREVLMHAIEMHPSQGIQHRWTGIVKSVKRRGLFFATIFR
jgi:MFS family permease